MSKINNKHEKCLEKIRKQYDVEYMHFDLHNIVSWDSKTGKHIARGKSGQKVWYVEKGKKKEKVSFVAHIYCPWCGKKY